MRELPKTALNRITRLAIAWMGFNYELKFSPGEQMPHALSRTDFHEDESDDDRACCTFNKIYLNITELVSQEEIRTGLGTNILFQDIAKRIRSGNYRKCSEAEKGFAHQKDAFTEYKGIIFRGVVPFIPTKHRRLVLAKA